MPATLEKTMTRFLSPILFILFSCLIPLTATAETLTIHVASNGDETQPGTEREKPTTLAGAVKQLVGPLRDRMKTLEGIDFVLNDGIYTVNEPWVLTPECSGTPTCPIRFTGVGRPVISGGRPITNWQRVKDNLWATDIPEVKAGAWSFRELYMDGKRQRRARTPNEGFFRVAACPEGTPKTVNYHTDCQSFEFKPGDIDPHWKNLNDVEVVVYYFWSDNHLPIESIDAEKNIVKFKYKGGKTFTDDFSEDGARYIVENVFEALDQPGEWYLDKKEGRLYLMTDGDPNRQEIMAPLAKSLLELRGDAVKQKPVENIAFRNIEFRYCGFEFGPNQVNDRQGSSEVTAAIVLRGARNVTFERCRFRQLGTFALEMQEGCQSNSIRHNVFAELAAGAIRMTGGGGGSHPLSHTRDNEIADNRINGYGELYPSAVGVILQNTYGNRVEHNEIAKGYYTGISVGWTWGYGRSISRDNIVAFNHIHDIGQGLLSDMGGIYTLGPSPGTVIANNLIHDIDANKYGGWGIYNDEGSTGILVENNIVYNTKFAGYDMHYGRDITIRNNVFAFGRMDQINRTAADLHLSLFFENNIVYWKEGVLFSGNWSEKSYKYYFGPGEQRLREYTRNFESDYNVFYNPTKKIGEVEFFKKPFAEWQKSGKDRNSLYADPKFVAPEKYDFRLQPDSPAFALGFRPIDLSGVGPRTPTSPIP